MRQLVLVSAFGAMLGATPFLAAQDEKVRTGCDKADPANKCTVAADCLCADETMEITFDGLTQSTLEVDASKVGTEIETTVVMDTKSNKVQGWSFGVDHDDTFLTLNAVDDQNPTVIGTDAEVAKNGGFAVADGTEIETCKNSDAKCTTPAAAHGYVTAVILSFIQPITLPVERNTLIKAKYSLKAAPDANGTVLQVVDYLKVKNSPPADINVTIEGKSRTPVTLIDGWVKGAGGGTPENCTNGTDDDGDSAIDCKDTDCPPCPPENCTTPGDEDLDGKADCADEDCANTPACQPGTCLDYALYFGPAASTTVLAVGAGTSYPITMRNKAASFGFQLGVKSATAGASTTWSFAGTLGTDANRLIELIITDDQGNSQTPQTPNTATSNIGTVASIDRGTAIAGFSAKDFFAFDLAPGVGGPGFTVGYVADTNPTGAGNKIAATGEANPCPVNEVLKVNLGTATGTNFSRGDADGNSKINVTDAVLIIQIVVGNLQERFACRDILDANDDGTVNVADAIPVLEYVFRKGDPLPAPFRACAADPTADALTCTASNCQ